MITDLIEISMNELEILETMAIEAIVLREENANLKVALEELLENPDPIMRVFSETVFDKN